MDHWHFEQSGGRAMTATRSRFSMYMIVALLSMPLSFLISVVTGCGCGCGGPPGPQPTVPPTVIPSILPNPDPTNARLPPEGCIFEATPCRIRGCAYDPKYPSDKIKVTLYIDKVAVGTVTADQDDVRQCETVRGHGFSFGVEYPAGTRVEIVGTGREPGDSKAIATATIVAPCK
jgi:hypothetical protein